MRKRLRGLVPFITFDLPLQYENIEQLFVKVQHREQQRYSDWSAAATLKKVAYHYWYQYVLIHFSSLFGLACLINLPVTALRTNTILLSPIVYTACGVILFAILLFTHYTPFYYSDFLPKLQTIAATYEGRQLAQLEKCKQAQYSNLALVLIFYVWDKTDNLNAGLSIDQLSKILMKLYGVDGGSIRKNIELIFNKRSQLSPRKQKEVEKGFEEAYSFFDEVGHKKGTSLLKDLEMKLKRS